MSIMKMRQSFSKAFKPILIAIAGTFVIGGVYWGFGGGGAGGQGPGSAQSRIVASVNGEKIPRKDYETLLQSRLDYYQEMQPGGGALLQIQTRAETINALIEDRLRVQAAKREGVGVGRRDVSQAIDKAVQQRVDQLRNQLLGPGQKASEATDRLLDRRLKEISPGDSLARRIKMYESQYPRDRVRGLLMVQKLEEKIRNSVKLTDQQLRDHFTELVARQILIRGGDVRPDAQAKRRAEEVLKKAKAGEDFAGLARQYSEDPLTKNKGGLLPPFGRGVMVQEFEDAAFALKPGQISGVVKTQFGYHIIKLEEIRPSLPPDFDQKRKEYYDQVLLQKRSEAVADYWAKLRENAKIEVYDPFLKALAMQLEAERYRSNPSVFQEKINAAIRQYKTCIGKESTDQPDWMSRIQLAALYYDMGKADEAIKLIRAVLDQAMVEGADLRLMLGRLYLEKGDKQRALDSLLEAAEVGYPDQNIHAQLVEAFGKLGRPDLVAKEKKWLQEYARRQMEAQGRTPGGGGPTRVPAPPPSGQ